MSDQPFTMDPDWLPYHPDPSEPAFKAPKGAVDAHCHVFGPSAKFPFAPDRKYTPCDASKESLWQLRDHLGFERNVIVQASCHGQDNSALIDALADAGDRARGVVSINVDTSDEELKRMHLAGVRGARFNFVRRLVDPKPDSVYRRIADRLAELGWHIVVYFEAQDLAERFDFFSSLPTPIVIDHMGRPDTRGPVHGGEFDRLIKLLQTRNDSWCKVSCPERLSLSGPPDYSDVIPFAQRICEEFPDQVLWGTDWPHPNMKSHMPDDGALVDFIPRIARTEELQQKLLVGNPMRLYWS